VSLIAYVFTKVSVTLFAGGIVFETLFPVDLIEGMSNFWLGAMILVLVTGAYTVLGGLRAVVYTEVVQTLVLIIGSVAVTVLGLYQLGGWSELRAALPAEHFNLWKPMTHDSFPWLGMLIGAPIVGLWYWCTDQYIVQRTLAAPSQAEARRGTIFGAYLKLSAPFLFIIPGMIAFALAHSGDPQFAAFEVIKERSNQAYPLMVREMLPAGIRGLVVGGLLAALMSSLSSVFNSSSTLFTIDVYKKLRPQTSERTLVWIGRVATGVMVVLGILWIPFMKYVSDALYEYLQAVQAYVAPPIFAVFFLGVFSKRINSAGCMAGLISGFVLGMARLVAEIFKGSLEGTPLFLFADLNFLYFCIVLLAVSVAVIVVTSLLTAPPSEEQLRGLTYATTSKEDREETRASTTKWDVAHTFIIIGIILTIYVLFSGLVIKGV
jgi:SSS family solute:Na+ symporter